MADIVATQRNRIQSGVLGDKDTASCSGTPGGGTLDSAYIYVNTYINTALDSDGYLWFANTSGYVRQTGMIDGTGTRYWFSSCMVDKDAFNVTYGGDYGTFNDLYAGKYHQVELWKSIGVDLSFTGNTTYSVTTSPATTAAAQSAGYWNSGYTIDDCDPTTSGGVTTIDLYVAYPVFRTTDSSGNTGGTSDTPTSFNAVKFSFDVTELVDYYPFAVYSSSAWQSCNRDGGALKKYSGSAWNDLKNIEDNTSDSTVFYYANSSWSNICPKIGNE